MEKLSGIFQAKHLFSTNSPTAAKMSIGKWFILRWTKK